MKKKTTSLKRTSLWLDVNLHKSGACVSNQIEIKTQIDDIQRTPTLELVRMWRLIWLEFGVHEVPKGEKNKTLPMRCGRFRAEKKLRDGSAFRNSNSIIRFTDTDICFHILIVVPFCVLASDLRLFFRIFDANNKRATEPHTHTFYCLFISVNLCERAFRCYDAWNLIITISAIE